EDPILEQREVQGADDAAVDLAFRREPADHQPAILERQYPNDFHDAGLDVDFHFGKLNAGRGHRREPWLPRAVSRDRLRADLFAGLGPRHALGRIVFDLDASVGRDERCGVDTERRRDLFLERIERVDRGDPDCRADAGSRRAAARSAARWIDGVADLWLDVADRNTKGVSGNDSNERAGAGAEILRPAANHDRAVR